MKNNILTLIVVFVYLFANAQTEYFDYYYTGQNYIRVLDACEDDEGNFLLLITDLNTFSGEELTKIVKIDRYGEHVKEVDVLPNKKNTFFQNLYNLGSNKFLVYGATKVYSTSNYRPTIVEFDNNLNISWIKEFGSNTQLQNIAKIKYSQDSSYLICTGVVAPSNLFITQLNLNGDSIIQYLFAFTNPVDVYEFLQSANDKYYLFTWNTHMPNDSTTPNNNSGRLVVINQNLSIDTVVALKTKIPFFLANTVELEGATTAFWISADKFIMSSNGDYYPNNNPNYNPYDIVYAQWDTNLTEIKSELFGLYNRNDYVYRSSMDMIPGSHLIFASVDGYKNNTKVDSIYRYYVAKTDLDGNLIWENTYTNFSNLRISNILATKDGGALVLGSTYKSIINGSNEPDGYALKIDSTGYAEIWPVGMNNPNILNSHFNIYPNPTHNQLNINSSAQIDELTIYNHQGQIVNKLSNLSKNSIINIEHLSTGVYYLHFNSNQKVTVEKLVKY